MDICSLIARIKREKMMSIKACNSMERVKDLGIHVRVGTCTKRDYCPRSQSHPRGNNSVLRTLTAALSAPAEGTVEKTSEKTQD